MREKLQALLGAKWGEPTSQRRGYRNDYYLGNLGTSQGLIEDLKGPRDRWILT